MLEKIDELAAAAASDLESVANAGALEAYRVRYLGSKGAVKALMGLIKDVPKDQKREFGQRANAARAAVESAFAEKQEALGSGTQQTPVRGVKSSGGVDVTQPGDGDRLGRHHVITQTVDELIDVFGR
ncbi:MAG: phenylalanine--tRNA ligase subunit alpha, partial [Planctomycetota bacterium]